MKTSSKQISLFTEDKSTYSQEDSLANRIQQPDNEKGKRMNAISGRKCCESFARFNHVGSWAKTFSDLLIGQRDWSSKRCNLIWRLKGTKYKRLYFQLQQKTLRTEEIESGLLLTPTSVMTDEPPEKMREIAERNGYKNGTQYGSLLSQVKYSGMLPTPIKSDCTPARPTENWNGSDLGGFINRGNTGKIFQLNPQFVCEMMGFPPNWTELPFQNGEENQSKDTVTQ